MTEPFDPMAARRPGKPKTIDLLTPDGRAFQQEIPDDPVAESFLTIFDSLKDQDARLCRCIESQASHDLEIAMLKARVEKLERWRAARADLFWLVTGTAIGTLLWRIFGG